METALFLVDDVANSDRPSIGFCNEPLIGSKYDGLPARWAVSE